MQKVICQDLGMIDYKEAWDYQEDLFQEVVNIKIANRSLAEGAQLPQKHYLLFCEHPPVYTLGKSGHENHVLINEAERERRNIQYYKINRGGDITFHGPQQIVGYPILDLDFFFTDIHKYLRLLEEMIIRTLAEYNLPAGRLKGATGVWLDPDDLVRARKICAMGVRCSRWVTMHGFAFNINTDLDFFKYIVPCGIDDKAVTSMEKELGHQVPLQDVRKKLMHHFETLFDAEVTKQ